MTDNRNKIIAAVFIAIIFFAGGWALHPCPEPETREVIKVKQSPPEKVDSIVAKYIPYAVPQIKWKDKIIIRYLAKQGLPVDTVKSTDSAIIVRPFVAKSDTVTFTDGSKVQADYTFPSEEPFRFWYKPNPDTTKEIRIAVSPPWYEKPVFVSGTTAAVLTAIYLVFNKR